MNQAPLPGWQQWLVRTSNSGARSLLWLLAAICVIFIAQFVANWADTRRNGPTWFDAPSQLWDFRLSEKNATAPPCAGELCNALGINSLVQDAPTGAGFVALRAQVLLPPNIIIEAREGEYLQATGITDAVVPKLQYPTRKNEEGRLFVDFDSPLVLAKLWKGQAQRSIEVSEEGYLVSWSLAGTPPDSALQAWTPPPKVRSEDSQREAIARSQEWQAMKFRSLRFQPVPKLLRLRVPAMAQTQAIGPGYLVLLQWGGGLSGPPANAQIIADAAVLGVVRAKAAEGDSVVVSVEVPRTTSYGSSHWLYHRLSDLPAGQAVIPAEVGAQFFAPAVSDISTWPQEEASGAFARFEMAYNKLPRASMRSLPASALDPNCVQPVLPNNGCVWAQVHGVALPVQVTTVDFGRGQVGVQERGVFAGKSIAPAHWSKLPASARRELLGSGPANGTALAIAALQASTPILLKPLRADAVGKGLSVRVAESTKQ